MSAAPEGAELLWCRLCDADYPAADLFCRRHPTVELVPRPDEPAAAVPGGADGTAGQPRRVCWNCGTPSPNARNPTCASCHESLVPPALVIEFPDGAVVVATRGESAELGRAGRYGHVFARYPNVSRQHATVGVDEHGEAWVTPNPAAPNGTFVNGEEIGDRSPVHPGDQIRFATDRGPHIGPISERVRQPEQEPVRQVADAG